MTSLKSIDWNLVWDITKDFVIPHTGTLIFNSVLFVIIGLFLFIIYTIILFKKKILKRKPKYYNWAVKLYIPLLFCVFLYVFGQIGFIRGIYKILNKENDTIVTNIYNQTLGFAFETEESKNTFIKSIQSSAKEAKDGSVFLIKQLKETAVNNNSGILLIDNSKNKLSNYLLDKYGNDIYKIGTYGMLNVAGAKAHIDINESLPYSEYSAAMDFLLDVGYKDIELAIKEKLMVWFNTLLDSQYQTMIKSLLILFIVIISLPFIEYYIYKKWIEPDLLKNDIKQVEEF